MNKIGEIVHVRDDGSFINNLNIRRQKMNKLVINKKYKGLVDNGTHHSIPNLTVNSIPNLTVNLNKLLSIGSKLTVSGQILSYTGLKIGGGLTVNGDVTAKYLTVGGDLRVGGGLIVEGGLAVGGKLMVGKWVRVEGELIVNGELSVGSKLTVGGTIRYGKCVSVDGVSANRLILIHDAYRIAIYDRHMRIGCELHSITDWNKFTDDDIMRMGAKDGLEFWRKRRSWILGLCNLG